jgi:hypothetical protein
MCLPERTPEPEDFEARREPPRPSAAERPVWLVGAEEGAQSEYQRPGGVAPEPKLVRPTLPPEATARPRPAGDPPALTRPGDGAPAGLPLSSRAASAPAPGPGAKPVAWTAAGSSVPKLVQKPRSVVARDEPEVEDTFDAEPPATRAMLGVEDERAARQAPAPLDEPWWIVVGERLATDRKLQLVILSAILVVGAAWTFWPRASAGVSVREIRRHAEQWEGRAVHVRGRVGEVFSIGQGVVYHLHQGRDTIVVFSRSRTPEPRQRVSVQGTVSTGYLDGAARVAILENAGP